MNIPRMSTHSLASVRGSGPRRCALHVVSVAQAPSLHHVSPPTPSHAVIPSYSAATGMTEMAKQSVNRKQVVSL